MYNLVLKYDMYERILLLDLSFQVCIKNESRSSSLRLVLPTVRASIENACARVARGEAHKSHVVERLAQRLRKSLIYFCIQKLFHKSQV